MEARIVDYYVGYITVDHTHEEVKTVVIEVESFRLFLSKICPNGTPFLPMK